MNKEIVAQQHSCGVHLNCDKKCKYSGKVERFHSHDYDGPIECCDDEAVY